jgi:CheY-like chemotaxis protein
LIILVVDDNEVNRKVAGLLFRRFGYEVEFASDGLEAVNRVVHRALSPADGISYDLVFMDVHMPEMDGLEATRAIRQAAADRPGARWPRIVAMTAVAMHGDREVCLEAGMDDYLTKPLSFEAVGAVLEQVGQATRARPRPVAEEVPAPEPAPVVPEPSTVVDWARLEELREYDTPEAGVVKAAIGAFIGEAPTRLAEVRASAVSRDGQGLRESAHKLKGAASNVGALGVAQLAARLEQAGKARSLDGLEPLVESLSVTLLQTLAELHLGADRPAAAS